MACHQQSAGSPPCSPPCATQWVRVGLPPSGELTETTNGQQYWHKRQQLCQFRQSGGNGTCVVVVVVVVAVVVVVVVVGGGGGREYRVCLLTSHSKSVTIQ